LLISDFVVSADSEKIVINLRLVQPLQKNKNHYIVLMLICC